MFNLSLITKFTLTKLYTLVITCESEDLQSEQAICSSYLMELTETQ